MRRRQKTYRFFADKLMDDGCPHAQAKYISPHSGYHEIIKRHAAQMVKDGRGDWWFVRVEPDNESTLWALEDSTVTMRERYITAAA